jgi:SOS-response transcriptional repressor LexA
MTERATKKQQALLHYIKEFIREHDYGPSYREIMRALDYKSVSTVAVHVDGLIAKGFLARKDKSARSLEVVGMSPTAVQHAHDTRPKIVQAIEGVLQHGDLTEDRARAITMLLDALELLGHQEEATAFRKKLDERKQRHLA